MKIKAGMRFFHYFILINIIILMAAGCAKQGSPPGGAEDRTPPKIFATEPASGSVDVPVNSQIVIEFSEAIDRETVEKALFISPLPDPEPKIKIKSDAIVIEPRGDLQPDKTYVITIGSDLKDAHRVNLEQSLSIAFSTGSTIDSGSISGTVYRNGKGATGISLALFENEPQEMHEIIDSLVPGYITQSGEGGLFAFEYLPADTFYLVAFEDKNKNRRINSTREMIGVPHSILGLDSNTPSMSDVDIKIHLSDTSTLGLRSVTINPDRMVKVRFSSEITEFQADDLFADAHIIRKDDSSGKITIYEHTSLSSYPSSDFVLITDPVIAGQTYSLDINLRKLYPQIHDSLSTLSYDFTIPEGDDKTPPVLSESDPSKGTSNVNPGSTITLKFSEPIDSAFATSALKMVNAAEESTQVAISPMNQFTYTTEPQTSLGFGQSYNLLIDGSSIRDKAGNKMSDSMMVIAFNTIGLDTLGQLTGEIRFSIPEDAAYPVEISFNAAGEGEADKLTVSPGQVQFGIDLLPGYYTVSAFLDRNANGEFDYGTIIPYQFAEPFIAPPDTFRVRSRFESAGVELIF